MAANLPPRQEHSNENPYVEPFHRLARVLIELFVHLTVVLAVLGSIKIVEEWMVHLFGSKDYKFWDIEILKLRYIFDGADLFIIAGFLVIGVYYILKAYRKR